MSSLGVPMPRNRRFSGRDSPRSTPPGSPDAAAGWPPFAPGSTPRRRQGDKKRVDSDFVADPEKCFIVRLPDEVLVQVLSWLDPQSMNTLPALSRRFQILLSSPHPFLSALTLRFSRLPYLRLHRTWPQEYTARATLERAWAGGARAVVAEVGEVDGVWLELNGDRAIAWGDERAVQFDLTTGKVERNTVKIDSPCATVKADPSRAVFGSLSGGVLCAPNHGPAIPLKLPLFDNTSTGSEEPIGWREPHAVTTALAWDRGLTNLIASGGGEIVLWDVAGLAKNEERPRAVAILCFGLDSLPTPPSDHGGLPQPHVRKLVLDAKGHVFAFLSNGKLAIWNMDFMDLMFRPAPIRPPAPVAPSRMVEIASPDLVAMEHDSRAGRLLVVTIESACIYSLSGDLICTLEVPNAEGEISAAGWDRDHAAEEPPEDQPATLVDPEKPAPKRAQQGALVLATSVGTVLMYDVPVNGIPDRLVPRLILPVPDSSERPRTTHVISTPLLLISAHTDGHLHVRSVLSGALLRTLTVTGPPRVQRAIDSGKNGVTCLKAAEGRGRIAVGVVGGGIKIWSFAAVVEGGWAKKATQTKKKKNRARGKVTGVYGSPKQQALFDMRSDLSDMNMSAASSRQYHRAAGRLQGEFTPERGWSEEELLNYTLMLSLNEQGGGAAHRDAYDEDGEGDWDEREERGSTGGRYEEEWPSSFESGPGSWGGRSRNGSKTFKLGTSLSGPTSPTLRAVGASPVARGESPRVGARRREDMEDEELQFALQLSLVEK